MKLRHYTIITALALLAASCAHEESEVAQISDVQVVIEASFSDTASETKATTKSTATAFESGDLLGLYAVKSGGELNAASNIINNHQLKVAESGAIVGDLLPAYYPDKSSSLDLFSYYPYQSGNATADALGVLVGIRTHQADFSSLQASDLCYGQKLDAAPSAAPHPLQFRHSFAQLRLNFSLYEGCSAISAVKLLAIKDSAKLNLQTGLVTLLTSSVADVEPFVGSLSNSADATNPLQFTAIIPAQSLSGACVEITLTDGTIYYYHATAPIPLKESATNTLNLTLSDKGKLTLASTPAITAWGVESIISNISESTDNAFTFYWSPAITSFGSINKAFVTLTNPATKKSARIEVTSFVRDATSTAANAIFRFSITRTDAASIGYPVTIDKFELFNGGTAVHTLTDYYGRTVTRSGAHTFGTVTSIKLSPDGDWLNAANTAQSRSVTIATTGSTSWVASASPSGIGLSVSPTSGANSATATISWAAQVVGSLARNGEVTFKTTPDGITKIVSTEQLAGPAPTLTLAKTDAIDNPIPAGGKQYKTTITSNTAWTASALTNVTLDKSKGAAGATAVVVTVAATTSAAARTVSAIFTTNPLPSGAVASQTWSGNQIAYPQYITINGLKWATGNLVASGPNSCKIGAPIDGGLYFQFGSLLGWKGGASGDGTGVCTKANGTFYVGSSFNATDEIAVKPSAFTTIANIGTTWPNQTQNLYYFGNTSYATAYASLRNFAGFANGSLADKGVGDPCRYYLGGTWRMPTAEEFKALANNQGNGATPDAANAEWQASPAGMYFNNNSTKLFIPAYGCRGDNDGTIYRGGGHYWSESIFDSANGYYLVFGGNSINPNNPVRRRYGFPVRCVSN